MSIASVEVPQSHLLALWLIWSGVALALAPIALRGSGRTLFTRRLETSPVIGPLVISAVVTFVGWIGVAMAYGAVMQIIAGEGRTPEITGGHLVAISLAAPLGGLAAALAMLGAFELFETVGITRRRFPAAVLSGLIGITIALPVVWWVLEATLRAWEAMRFEHPAKHGLLEAMAHESRWWMNGAIVLSAVVIAPLFEEVLFRGLV
ncbi:MAG: hypothetical protein H7144_01350, partial [Burkholderiales bacterium]|nr:hypothetical protein [Phycisphaerae bacterium]